MKQAAATIPFERLSHILLVSVRRGCHWSAHGTHPQVVCAVNRHSGDSVSGAWQLDVLRDAAVVGSGEGICVPSIPVQRIQSIGSATTIPRVRDLDNRPVRQYSTLLRAHQVMPTHEISLSDMGISLSDRERRCINLSEQPMAKTRTLFGCRRW